MKIYRVIQICENIRGKITSYNRMGESIRNLARILEVIEPN